MVKIFSSTLLTILPLLYRPMYDVITTLQQAPWFIMADVFNYPNATKFCTETEHLL